jgi:hypothetical protein
MPNDDEILNRNIEKSKRGEMPASDALVNAIKSGEIIVNKQTRGVHPNANLSPQRIEELKVLLARSAKECE